MTGIGFPEGPAIRSGSPRVCTDADAGAVVTPGADGRASVLARVPDRVLGAAWRDSRTLLLARADPAGLVELDVGTGRPRVLVDGPRYGIRLVNDLALAADGSVYFTDTGADNDGFRGGLWRLGPDGPEPVLSGLVHANGVAVGDDRVYVAETTAGHVLSLSPDGTVRAHARMAGGVGPDGLAVDAAGRLYAAHYGAGVVRVFDAAGTEVAAVATPGAKPTNVTLHAGTLYVTEAETGALWAAPTVEIGLIAP